MANPPLSLQNPQFEHPSLLTPQLGYGQPFVCISLYTVNNRGYDLPNFWPI